MGTGKEKRLRKIIKPDQKTIIIPMDHGFTMGPIDGLENIKKTVIQVFKNGADGIIVHKGMAKRVIDSVPDDKILGIHLNAGTNMQKDSSIKAQVCSVEHALYWGADFVSYHLNIGTDKEAQYFKEIKQIQEECFKLGVPLLGMLYSKNMDSNDEFIHCIRVAEEIGLDMVKIWCPNNYEVVNKATKESEIPIFIAGGEYIDENQFIDRIKKLFTTDIAGLAAGRNIFSSDNTERVLKKICEIKKG